ncbi:MAG: hypothetical protein Ct9H300mP23_00510 [Nitrospinota bacterium]|nr:MAG: hypothetical protein Ct9H300mP23_00510 [Nitrospinota bacterium]
MIWGLHLSFCQVTNRQVETKNPICLKVVKTGPPSFYISQEKILLGLFIDLNWSKRRSKRFLLIVTDIFMTETAKMADLILPSSTYAEKDGTFTNMSRHVQGVASAVLPQGTSKPDFDILIELAETLGKPFEHSTLFEIQQEIEQAAPIYQGVFPGKESKQWIPATSNKKPVLKVNSTENASEVNHENYPFTLQTNNHMFHIGSYSQHAKALVDIGPECIAEIHPEDEKGVGGFLLEMKLS